MTAKTTVMRSRFVCQWLMMMKRRQLLMALMLLLLQLLMRDYLTSVTRLRCLETSNSRESAYHQHVTHVFIYSSFFARRLDMHVMYALTLQSTSSRAVSDNEANR